MKFLLLPISVFTVVSAGEITVKDNAGPKTALASLKPDTVLKIAPGDYGAGHYVANVSGVTIEALDPKNPPAFKEGK